MNKTQLAVIAVAAVAGIGAFMLSSSSPPPVQSPVAAIPVPAPPPTTDQVLVSTRDLSYGTALNEADTAWQDWPINSVPKGVIRKSETPNAKDDVKSSFVRVPVANGEPIRRERLIKGQTAGMMSTMLSSGKRAVAIDVSLTTTAGGFILPNDHVDIVRIYRDQELTKDRGVEVMTSEIVLSNVRVLAMGQTVETKNGEAVVTGATATLELDPHQAENVLLAQRTGTLSLSLRALADAVPGTEDAPPPADMQGDGTMTVVRFGVPANLHAK